MSASPPALQVQDICNYIADFLHGSPSDLRSCALISQAFTSSAQYHLFRAINLGVSHGMGTITDADQVLPTARRLCAILSTRPHLIPLIRRLSISFDVEILAQFANVHFTHVETLLFCGTRATCHSGRIVSLAAGLTSLPSVRRLKLWNITFQDMPTLRTLFHLRASPLDLLSLDNIEISLPPGPTATELPQTSLAPLTPIDAVGGDMSAPRFMVKGIELGASSPLRQDPTWLLHPLCPFDFAALTSLDIARNTLPGIVQFMHAASTSLVTLRIDARYLTPHFRFGSFPALHTLDIFGGMDSADATVAVLALLGANNRIEDLYISILVDWNLDTDSLRRLDATLSGRMAALRSMHVVLSHTTFSWSAPDAGARFIAQMPMLRTLFPNMDKQGCLRLTYVIDGIRTDV
ncbi:hypothetical protein FB451DRAFT_1261553 [Mycena latifolia]|nr:hypothetical protein FB451DRAFT_1261553 [Mycena latifolia]